MKGGALASLLRRVRGLPSSIPGGATTLATASVMAAFAASRWSVAGIASEREYDEGVYLLSARALASGERLFTEVFSSQPPAFLESLALVIRITGDRLESAQAFSLCWALVAVAAVADLARRIAGPLAAPLAATALVAGATFTDLAHMVQAETPALALALVAMSIALRAQERGWPSASLLLSGATFASALLFKLFVAPLVLPLGALLLLRGPDASASTGIAPPLAGKDGRARPWSLDWPGAPRRLAWVAAAGAAVLALPLLFYDAAAMIEQTVTFHLAKFDVYDASPKANTIRALKLLASDPVVTMAALAGAVALARRNARAASWLVLWFATMMLTVREQTPLFWRHLVLLAPPLAILAGSAVALALESATRRTRTLIGALAMAAMLVPAAASPRHGLALFPSLPLPADLEWPIGPEADDSTAPGIAKTALWIRRHTKAGDLVAGDDPIVVYLSGRRAPGALCDTSTARIRSRSLTLEKATRHSAAARVIVLRANGRLSKLRGYRRWLAEHYDEQDSTEIRPGETRRVWIRRDPPAGADR
jgi:hypothetical protein